ncbi:MAG: polysaccharide biosynthesis C-terminal domain-containing protein [Robiginitomaculum sp.]
MWKQLIKYVPVNIASIVVSFGSIAILTRLFTGAEFGRYTLAIAAMHFVHMAAFTWIEAAMSRFYARAEREGKMASHLKTSYTVGIIMAVTSLPIFLGLVHILPLEPRMKMLLSFASFSTCFTLVYNIGIESHKAAHRIGRYSVIQSSQSLLGFSVGIIIILMTDLREVSPFIGIFIANTIAIIIDLPFMLRRMKGGVVTKKRTLNYFTYGMPICLSLMLTYTLSQGDLVLIKYFMDDTAVGQYNAGYNLANRSLDMLFVWIGTAVTPIAITTLEQEGLEKTREVFKNFGEIMLLVILPAATGVALVAEPAGFILGESVRAQAVKIIPWVAFAAVFNGFITYYVLRAFIVSKNTVILALTMIPPVIINVGLNIYLIPKYGLMGAVWATVISYAAGFVISMIVVRRCFPLPLPFKALMKTGFSCAVMAGAVLALPNSINALPDLAELLIKALVGAVVYCLVAFATNAANCCGLIQELLTKIKQKKASQADEMPA